MKVFKKPVEFDWDEGNIGKNLKHGVEDKESEEPFLAEFNLVMGDDKHSEEEKRYLLLGQTKNERKLSIIFTVRDKKVRIISSRDMNKKERRKYEEETKSNPEI